MRCIKVSKYWREESSTSVLQFLFPPFDICQLTPLVEPSDVFCWAKFSVAISLACSYQLKNWHAIAGQDGEGHLKQDLQFIL